MYQVFYAKMAKPCAVFWDIQNVGIPRGQSANSIVNLIRSTIIKPHNLNEISFFCVCDVNKLPANVGNSLIALDVDIVQAYNKFKDSADIKILDLMRKFVKHAGQDCTIILLSGDADYYGTLSDLKKLHNVSIHLVRLAHSFSPKLDQIADYAFMLNDGVLKPIKSTGVPMYFISVKNYPLTMDIKFVMDTLNSQIAESIQKSAILFDDLICIGFPTLWNAEKAIEQLNGSRFHGHFLKAELLLDSSLTEILKCIKPNKTMKMKNNKEVKRLTFIKMSISMETDNRKIIKFCIACTKQSGSQCILSRKPFLWIVFSFKSDAQDCLSKVQIMYPDAIIADPPVDLTSKYHENLYTVESCEQKVTNEAISQADNAAEPKPKKDIQASSQNQSSSNCHYANIGPSTDIKPRAAKESATLKNTMNSEPRIVSDTNFCDNNDWKIFFRCDNYFVSHVLRYQPTKWSLLYDLFEKLYDLGAKKVMFDGNVYCAHFDSVSAYDHAFTEKRSRFLKPLESINAEGLTKKFTANMNRYVHEIPWCLNSELDIHCLVVKVNEHIHIELKEMCKKILGNRECIFIKPVLDEFWIGFPDELICKNSKKTVLRFLADLKYLNDVSMAKPSNALLESVNLHDLVGDAYDLAFLSAQLESTKPIAKPQIIERISCLRTEEQECNATVFHITIGANFRNWMSWVQLSLEQIVKMIVYFSKVIPLAATASYDEATLIFNSWYEAHVAHHFINNLTLAEVPYFREIHRAREVQQQQLPCASIFKYYIINDKRKVLDKIIQNRSLVDRLHLNSSTNKSTPNIDLLDGEITKKLQYLYTITTKSDFKLTSGMISIIKMNLVQMDCPVCIEFQDEIWVAADDLEKGNKAKARIDQIKFKMLHEKDEDDFEVGVTMQLAPSSPTEAAKMLANKLMNPTEAPSSKVNSIPSVVPLGHFNYNYRRAVGMPISKYCELHVTAGP
uniref:NYN domain-containing protein n=1 Tax=Tetranychus urticae TaxID=32264 RepID=T1KGI4_TETUR